MKKWSFKLYQYIQGFDRFRSRCINHVWEDRQYQFFWDTMRNKLRNDRLPTLTLENEKAVTFAVNRMTKNEATFA